MKYLIIITLFIFSGCDTERDKLDRAHYKSGFKYRFNSNLYCNSYKALGDDYYNIRGKVYGPGRIYVLNGSRDSVLQSRNR